MRRGLLASREELSALRERISQAPFDAFYDRLVRRCSLILEAAPVTEQQWRMEWDRGRWGSALAAARTTQGRLFDLLIAHHIEPNTAYRDRAIEELRNLARWSQWVDPCYNHVPADLCTAEAGVAAAVGLDWLWEDLTEADRLRVIHAIRHKVVEPYNQAVADKAWWYTCYHHWNAVVNSGCGLAAMALGDEEPAAEEAYHHARTGLASFFDALGHEGGWDEGTGFWGLAMRYVLLLGEATTRCLDDQRILHRRGIDATGLFGVYFTPNGHAASFGDEAGVPLYGTFYLLTKHFGVREVTWWLDTYAFHSDVSTSGYSAAGLAMLFRPPDAETNGPGDLKPVKVFNEIGWAAVADRWPRPHAYVAVKTGDLSANLSQRDMNSLQLQVDGEMLLTDVGNAPASKAYLSEARGEFYEVQARAHNTIVVADQDHALDAQGSIVDAQEAPAFRWLVCDAGEACGDNVQFLRHIVLVVDPETGAGRMLCVLDELSLPTPETVSLLWHTQGQIELEDGADTGAILGRRSELHFALASTVGSTVSTESHVLSRRGSDHVLRVDAGVAGSALFCSVFALDAAPGKLQLKQGRKGDVSIQAGETSLHFKRRKHRLQLDRVEIK